MKLPSDITLIIVAIFLLTIAVLGIAVYLVVNR